MHENDPVMRSRKLFDFFDWQGGTIHQIAAETGVDVETLLYDSNVVNHDKFSQGCLAAETCGPFARANLVPLVRGNRDFWIGVACSIRLDSSLESR